MVESSTPPFHGSASNPSLSQFGQQLNPPYNPQTQNPGFTSQNQPYNPAFSPQSSQLSQDNMQLAQRNSKLTEQNAKLTEQVRICFGLHSNFVKVLLSSREVQLNSQDEAKITILLKKYK